MNTNTAKFLLLGVASALPLASCATTKPQPPNTLVQEDIIKLHELPDLSRAVTVRGTFFEGCVGHPLSPASVRTGRSARYENWKNEKVPVDYELPETVDMDSDGGSFPVTPANPTKFRTVKTGWSVELTPRIDGAFVKIDVDVIHISRERKKGVFGEGSGPVVVDHQGAFRKIWVHLTDNVGFLPEIHTREQSFVVRALPGKKYRVPVSGLGALLIEVE